MNELNKPDYKKMIFQRYIGQFQQSNEESATIWKTSENIAEDLSEMASYSINEISEYMIEFRYQIGFRDSTPVWLMRSLDNKKIDS